MLYGASVGASSSIFLTHYGRGWTPPSSLWRESLMGSPDVMGCLRHHTTSTFAQSKRGLPRNEGSLSSTKRSPGDNQPSEPQSIKATHVLLLLPIIFYYSAQIWPHIALLSLLSGTYLQTAIITLSYYFFEGADRRLC